MKIDPEKVKAIKEYKPPTSIKELRSFLGFANYCRDFIKEFTDLASPIIDN